ncbi:MAG: transketolase-like TK C-terminal-containing protein, partial [Polynucleobacter victoriensis]
SRENMLNPASKPVLSHVEKLLKDKSGPVIAATDYVRMFAEQIRPAIQNIGKCYTVLGTDGYGRSDTREKLRHFFEVDRRWVTVAALKTLADEGQIEHQKVAEAIKK